MMAGLELSALRGHNPLGFFAAVGALDVVTRAVPERPVTLRWTDELEPCALLQGPDSIDHLVALCDADRERWAPSVVFDWELKGVPLKDLKMAPDELRSWIEEARSRVIEAAGSRAEAMADLHLLAGLVAEGALAGKGDTKPTHLHFTAGRQLFLVMARELREGLDAERFREALVGPWRYDSPLPSFNWDTRGERIHALRGFDPASEKRMGVPGADWLALLGMRFFPVAAVRGTAVTTGCSGSWKSGSFTWPLWYIDLPAPTVAALLADRSLTGLGASARRRLGVHHVLRAPIRRSEQGGYGSFGAPEPVFGAAQGRRAAR